MWRPMVVHLSELILWLVEGFAQVMCITFPQILHEADTCDRGLNACISYYLMMFVREVC